MGRGEAWRGREAKSVGEVQSVGPASALVGTLPLATPGGSVTPCQPPDGDLPSTEGGSGGGGPAGTANAQPSVGWRGSGGKVGFEVQGGGAGQREGG